MTRTTLLDHSTLGPIRGRRFKSNNTTQFRGLKYASIPGRFQDPILLNNHLQNGRSGEINGVKFGPSCPQHPGGWKFDLNLIGDLKLDKLGDSSQGVNDEDEFECCNLIVTLPDRPEVVQDRGLPVFVWIHGGGFAFGSNSWPQYDLTKFVEKSANIGKPVIGVSINYRLNIFGFLASEELGVSGNYGLKDQACAFKWIQKHISGFGGDPNMITAAGESAGSSTIPSLSNTSTKSLVSIHHHLLSKEPLFNRAILMSGDITLRRSRSKKWQERHYLANSKLLGLDSLSSEERKEAFMKMPAEELVKRLPMSQPWSPNIDGAYIQHDVDLGMLSDPSNLIGKPDWCREIMIGSTLHDGTILKSRVMDNPNIMTLLHNSLSSLISPAQKAELLRKYFPETPLTPRTHFIGLLNLTSDLRFHLAAVKIAEGYTSSTHKRKAYRYHFAHPNPFPGLYTNLASHELDVAYLLQNFDSAMPNDNHKISQEMNNVFINFTYGEGFGTASQGKEEDVLVFGHQGDEDVMGFWGKEEFDKRFMDGRGTLMEEIGWEKCFELGERLQGVSGDDPYRDIEKRV